jgi:hypothetical protein
MNKNLKWVVICFCFVALSLIVSSCGSEQAFSQTLSPSQTSTLIPTSTNTPIPTNTPILTVSKTPTSEPTATTTPVSTFAVSEMSNPAVDVTDIRINIKGKSVEALFYLKDVPTELTFQRDGVLMNAAEYEWTICVDTDNNKKTGESTPRVTKGSDYCLTAMAFKYKDSPTNMPIEQGVQADVWKLSGMGSDLFSVSSIEVDPEKNTIKLSGKIPGITDTSQFYYITSDANPGGVSETNIGQLFDRVAFKP